MNKKEANNIPAGRELDVLIGKLLGYEWITTGLNYLPSMGYVLVLQDDGIWKFGNDLAYFWSPSKDISVAWEVVNKFSVLHLFILERDPNDLEWNCSFNAKHGIGFADTAPLAISRAALLIFEP